MIGLSRRFLVLLAVVFALGPLQPSGRQQGAPAPATLTDSHSVGALETPFNGPPRQDRYDVILRGGVVIDGTGAPGRVADVAVRGGAIAAVGSLGPAAADREIDAAGLYVAPGFIDLHSHADEGLADADRGGAVNFLTQGVTTAVVGQDGASAWPRGSTLHEQAARWRSSGIGLSVVPLVGHASVRREVLKRAGCQPADSDELAAMARRVDDAIAQGAWGLSTGVAFTPCASFLELVEVTRPVARAGAVHISHVRDEAGGLFGAITEMLLVGASTGARIVVSHIKASGWENWGSAAGMIDILNTARKAGVDVYADLYAYTTSGGGHDVASCPRSIRSRCPKTTGARVPEICVDG